MPIDHGAPGAASRYYGTGASEARRRARRDDNALKGAYASGRKDAYDAGAASPPAYNAGLDVRAAELRAASVWRSRAVRKVTQGEGK